MEITSTRLFIKLQPFVRIKSYENVNKTRRNSSLFIYEEKYLFHVIGKLFVNPRRIRRRRRPYPRSSHVPRESPVPTDDAIRCNRQRCEHFRRVKKYFSDVIVFSTNHKSSRFYKLQPPTCDKSCKGFMRIFSANFF